jgi:hypothetical protein
MPELCGGEAAGRDRRGAGLTDTPGQVEDGVVAAYFGVIAKMREADGAK